MSDNNCMQCLKPLMRAKKLTCQHCEKIFHSNCAKLVVVRDAEDRLMSICGPCSLDHRNLFSIVESEIRTRSGSQSSATSSVNSLDTRIDTLPTPSDGRNSALSTSGASSMGPMDSFQESIVKHLAALTSGLSTFKAEVNSNLENLNKKCEPLDLLPQLVNRVDVLEGQVLSMQREQQELRELITQRNSAPPLQDLRLQEMSREIDLKLQRIKATQSTMRTGALVISGLDYGSGQNFDLMALTVLKTLRPSLTDHDIISVRLMKPKRVTDSSKANSASPEMDPSPTAGAVARPPRQFYPLAVTLISPVLVQAIVRAKIMRKTLKASSLDQQALSQAGCSMPIPDNNININEMLEGEAWKLKRLVLEKSRDGGTRLFSTFTIQGRIYVKKKKEDTPRLITSKDDLELFLRTA